MRHSPGWSSVELGDVDSLGGIGVAGGVLGRERGLGLEALDAGRIGALNAAIGAVGGIDGDIGVCDLLALDGEDAEAEAVAALGEDLARR